MRFLVDENLSPRLAVLLTASGHDAVHIRDLGLEGVSDADAMSTAVDDGRVIISADTDFGALLAHSRATEPSVILVRALVDRRPPELAGILLANLERLSGHLQAGAIVAFTATQARVRPLPLL